VTVGSTFEIVVEVVNVTSLNSASYRIQFNPTGFTITGVLPGKIGDEDFPVDAWNLVNNSTLAVVQILSGLNTVSGDGVLARIQADYSGGTDQTDTFAFDTGSSFLGNDQGNAIPTSWEGTTVRRVSTE
jgi:hypothetical protein